MALLSCLVMRAPNALEERLRAFRRALDLTQQEFAEQLGLKRTTYTSYEDGRANIPVKIFKQLEKMGFSETPEVTNPTFPSGVPVTKIPRGPAVPCSGWSDPLDTDYEDFQDVDSYMAGKGRFSCDIIGDSMYDLLWPGDTCVWQSDKNPKLGTIVIAVNLEQEATCAQLKHDGTEFILHKLNPKYPAATSDHWECVGFLVGIIRTQGTKRVAVYDPAGIRP